jgi:hypothetical protein
MDETLSEFLVEVVDEATGASSSRWALLLVALVAGAALVLWLTGRRSEDSPDAVRTDERV